MYVNMLVDFSLSNDSVVKNNDLDLVLQQIDILFDTKPKEVLGFERFGTKYEYYLYNLKISNSALKQTVLSDLYSLDLLGFEPTVEVHLLQGTEQDIALIEIVLTRDDTQYQQIYKIS